MATEITGAGERAVTIGRRALLVAWDIAILGALAVYAGQFGRLPAQSTVFPRLVAYPVAVLALASLGVECAQLVRGHAVRRSGAAGRGEAPTQVHAEAARATVDEGPPIRLLQLLLGLALGVAYLFFWAPLGFELDTVVFLVGTPLLLGQPLRRLPTLVAIGVVTAVLFTFLFHLGSGAILPAGAFGLKWP